ncbi:Phosphatidylglycerol--prolipoprotein diacylglyceryl transferase [Buchnera aphidicola (Protaphis terricola)]
MYITFPKLNPIIFSIGPLSIRWYGLMYVISFIFAFFYGKKYLKKKNNKIQIDQFLYTIFFSSCIGGRIGYILFYNFSYFTQNILCIFHIWEGGMSFHGGLIGAIISIYYISIKNKIKFLIISDFLVPIIPFCLAAGRLGNLINGELWGRVAINFPYAVISSNTKFYDLKLALNNPELQPIIEKYGALPRHPSQIYEFILEGILLFLIIYLFKKKAIGSLSSIFLISYGILRIIAEIFREPDPQIGLIQNFITMGQILSIPMIIFGCIIFILIYKKKCI